MNLSDEGSRYAGEIKTKGGREGQERRDSQRQPMTACLLPNLE